MNAKATKTDRKTQVQVLLARFGTCGCKNHCAVKQNSDPDAAGEEKPNGRFSQCELECEQLGIPVPEKAEEE